ncbi:hypothetical protein HPP92_024988 [Vanilla planifolia]|uniref:Enoyl reductase (ER) domain-containing protein n=1 Tax=Vanilla planifolia TaxID=51239 RepID=A0A835PI86_VANPL|nr:hypothetical protein HPP92_024988 [Vanilla planifolia]
MEALLCREIGDPTVPLSSSSPIVLSHSHPVPELNSPTSVRVRVWATSVNFANYLQLLGQYQEKPSPICPGIRLFRRRGVCGERVSDLELGTRFFVPNGCDLVAAAALPVAFGTSHMALVHRAQLKAGQVLLVLGAAGGVGLSAVQIGKICGAIVIAVARRLTGVDVLYDPVGGKAMKDSMKLLKWGAKILVIGFASGEVPVIPANIALVKNWTIHGLYWGSYKIHDPRVLEDSLKELLSWLSKNLITIHISHSYRLSEANLAFAAIKDRKAIGKVMVVMETNTQPMSKF